VIPTDKNDGVNIINQTRVMDMLFLIQKDDLNKYLESSKVVNYNYPEIQEKARELASDQGRLKQRKTFTIF